MVHLGELLIGERARIVGYAACTQHYRHKLLIMGLIPGTELKVIGIAPLGDPINVSSRGLSLCLRRCEAHILKLEKLGN